MKSEVLNGIVKTVLCAHFTGNLYEKGTFICIRSKGMVTNLCLSAHYFSLQLGGVAGLAIEWPSDGCVGVLTVLTDRRPAKDGWDQ